MSQWCCDKPPASQPPGTPWREISGWWLAVEVYSPSSRVYDREFKRPAYLRLGVREVWLVDPWEQEILSLRQGDARETAVRDQIRWQADGMSAPLVIPLPRLFEGLRISLPE
ncbi:MAG TPA: Uma2 family endonuclease [Gemmatimonadales bacterium]|jgi:Uma2 family endonuclease